ncbi:hypothetical protein PHISCL_05184 [Aspergillus sclerotialis]|uniref:Uncharacterized protein n=1 Tax=Aspergillus sclerotialis TaxID=2070753 RepID=A0A3A2ZH29_9EURO|nr:hypothetical protein PHISCL_05184 [Aspergillus sclerotialis]
MPCPTIASEASRILKEHLLNNQDLRLPEAIKSHIDFIKLTPENSRIEHLEEVVQILQNRTPEGPSIVNILQEKEALHAENLRLRKLIRNVTSILSGNEGLGSTDGQEDEHNSSLRVGSTFKDAGTLTPSNAPIMHHIDSTSITYDTCCLTLCWFEQRNR